MIARRRFTATTVGFFCATALLAGHSRGSEFDITIAREYRGRRCMSGYLAVNGRVIAYTLELPWHGNAPLLSSIPPGTYAGFLRYDHPDHWRIELENVPGHRTHIQIHIGNTVADTEGCIIVGTKLSKDLCVLKGGSSVVAYRALKKAFYGTASPIATPDKSIRVTIADQK
jgi:Family of unknown function (DUF5675)